MSHQMPQFLKQATVCPEFFAIATEKIAVVGGHQGRMSNLQVTFVGSLERDPNWHASMRC